MCQSMKDGGGQILVTWWQTYAKIYLHFLMLFSFHLNTNSYMENKRKPELACMLTLLCTSANLAFFTRVLLQNFIHWAAKQQCWLCIRHQAGMLKGDAFLLAWHYKCLSLSTFNIEAPGSANSWMVKDSKAEPFPQLCSLDQPRIQTSCVKSSGACQGICETLGLTARTILLTLFSKWK